MVILVTDDRAQEVTLMSGAPESVDWGGLPDEAELDRHTQAAAIRRAAYDPRLVSRVPWSA